MTARLYMVVDRNGHLIGRRLSELSLDEFVNVMRRRDPEARRADALMTQKVGVWMRQWHMLVGRLVIRLERPDLWFAPTPSVGFKPVVVVDQLTPGWFPLGP